MFKWGFLLVGILYVCFVLPHGGVGFFSATEDVRLAIVICVVAIPCRFGVDPVFAKG